MMNREDYKDEKKLSEDYNDVREEMQELGCIIADYTSENRTLFVSKHHTQLSTVLMATKQTESFILKEMGKEVSKERAKNEQLNRIAEDSKNRNR